LLRDAANMSLERALVIDADPAAGAALRAPLLAAGLETVEVQGLEAATGPLTSLRPAVVLVDVTLPGCEGPALATRLHALGSDAAVVVVVTPDRLDLAVAALRGGAEAFLARPLDPGHAALVLLRAAEKRRLRLEGDRLREQVRGRLTLVGAGAEMISTHEVVRRVAPTKATVLVQGEAGTGKDHLAQVLHELSPRRDAPFIRVSCAALGEALLDSELFGHEAGAFEGAEHRRIGAFERAAGGTLYLDEVGRLPPQVQVKVLRVLQEATLERLGGREPVAVDVRVVAGTQYGLAEEIHAGRFRDDLYYRLNVVSLQLPPLRERKADIPALVSHFLDHHGRGEGRPVAKELERYLAHGLLHLLGFDHERPGEARRMALKEAELARDEGLVGAVLRERRREADKERWTRSRTSTSTRSRSGSTARGTRARSSRAGSRR